MSNIVPSKALDKISFYENHNATWLAAAISIGTTSAKVTALTTRTTAARDAYNAQQLAKDQAKTATNTYKDAVAAMAVAGSDILKDIKAKAATDGNSIYDLALIPPPALPTPVGPPGTPTDFAVVLNPDGSLKLNWKCANPSGSVGTSYQIFRKDAGASDFAFIGSSGKKSLTDTTVSSGSSPITYKIVAVRSTAIGTAAQFIVNFGTSGAGGEMTASVVSEPAARLAA